MRRCTTMVLALSALAFVIPGEGSGAQEAGETGGSTKEELSTRGQRFTTVDGLVLVDDNRNGTLYVRPDHHIGSYDTIRVDPFTLRYRRSQRALSEHETKRLGEHLMSEFRKSIIADGLELKQDPDECTVAMQVHMVDLELLDLEDSSGSSSRFISSAGSVMLIFEMSDALSGQPLVRYGQRRTLPGGKLLGVPGALSTTGLGNAIAKLMDEIGKRMATAVPLTTRLRDVDCEGRLFKAAGRGRPVPR